MMAEGVQRPVGTDRPMFDPLVEGFFEDPYDHYNLLRERNPVHVDERGVVFFFGYDDVRRVLIDPRNTSMDRSRALLPRMDGTPRAAPPTFPLSILNRDPPDHSRLRRLLSRAFTESNIESLVLWMADQVELLLSELEDRQREMDVPVDLVANLAFLFPFRVISHVLGMPDGDDLQVRDWAHAIRLASDPIVSGTKVTESIAAYKAISEYTRSEVLPWKQANPGDDLLSHLLVAHGDDKLSMDELLDNVALLYVAGHETTTGLIGNGILNLLRNRRQLELLHEDASLLTNAVDELNRYDSSVQFAWRYVIDNFTVGNVTLSPGDMAFVSCGSANRDPDHFGARADRLDLTRANAKDLLSYGAGMHFCLGTHLARREAALVLGKLFERFPNLELAGEPRWGRSVTFRSVEQLPVFLG